VAATRRLELMRQNAAPPRGILHHPSVTDGSVTHDRTLPPPSLAPVVAHFWSVTWELQQPKFVATLSHPTVHFVFDADRAELAGVPTKRFERTLTGRGWVFGCKLRPGTLRAFLDAPAATFTDRIVPLTLAFGTVAAEWAHDVFAAPASHDARIAAIVPHLLTALRPLPDAAVALRDLCERAATDPSIVRVEQLAALAHQSPRSLQRHFLVAVGVSPKWVIRRYRLHEAAERLRAPASARSSSSSLAALAAELGYADQAHFSRDFAAAVGQTPTQFLRALPLT